LPQSYGLVPRASHDVPAVREKGDGPDEAGMALEAPDLASARYVPEPRRFVRRRGDDVLAIGGEGDGGLGEHSGFGGRLARVALELPDFTSTCRLPQPQHPVIEVCGEEDVLAVRGEG